MTITGLTKEEIYEVISAVAKNHKNKSFECYTPDDIEQEVWVIALQKLPEFELDRTKQTNLKKSLEHWLNKVVSNRLSNFYRDKWTVPNKEHIKNSQTLFNPEIDVQYLEKICNQDSNIFNNLILQENWQLILKNLNEVYFDILDSILNGEDVTPYYKIKLLSKIKTILEENTDGK